jgi:hypothetical protein
MSVTVSGKLSTAGKYENTIIPKIAYPIVTAIPPDKTDAIHFDIRKFFLPTRISGNPKELLLRSVQKTGTSGKAATIGTNIESQLPSPFENTIYDENDIFNESSSRG